MFKTIVLPVDGSEPSMLAVDYGKSLAESYGGKLIIVHAYPHTSDLRGYSEFNKLVSRRKMAGQDVISQAVNRMGRTSADVEEDLLEGPAAEAILTVADIRKAQLIVMGTRGMGSVKGLILGSVSLKVTQHAPCPVMVVR